MDNFGIIFILWQNKLGYFESNFKTKKRHETWFTASHEIETEVNRKERKEEKNGIDKMLVMKIFVRKLYAKVKDS